MLEKNPTLVKVTDITGCTVLKSAPHLGALLFSGVFLGCVCGGMTGKIFSSLRRCVQT